MKNFYLTVLLFLIFVNVLKAELPQSEKNALLAIAESLHFPSNWNADLPFEQWSGITISSVNGNDHVTEFVVTRTLPTSIQNINFSSQVQNLTHLKKLNLSFLGNSTAEIIFDFQYISNLNYLEDFAFEHNRLNYTNSILLLNTEKIADITSLINLTIYYNKENFEFPSNISNLTNLKKLNYRNLLSNFPNYIYGIHSLEELSIGFFAFEYPSHIANLTNLYNLKKLSLLTPENSNVISLPESAYHLPSLESLTIDFDYEIFISNAIQNYNNQLKELSLKADWIFHSPSLWNLNALETLHYWTDEQGIGIPSQVINLQNLKSLSVQAPYIEISNSIKNLQNLEDLYLGNRIFPGNGYLYPSEIYDIPNLKKLVIGYKNQIPETIGNLQNIEHIQITLYNITSPSLPESITNLSTLKMLDIFIHEYQNTINIPESYFNLNQLEQFWIMNNFNLNVTNKFLNLPNLKVLALENHTNNGNLSGTLNLCQNPNINILEVSNSTINKIDLRNNQPIANGELRWISLYNNPITNFYVDDVNVFQNLIDVNKVRINDNTQNYQISTSAEPCARVLGNTEITQNNKSKIFPNPVKDFIQFEADKTISDVEITNMAGQKFNLDVVFDNKVNASYLPKGVYVIKYKANGVYYLDKFIKN